MCVSNRNFGINAGVTQAHKQCPMKIKEKTKTKEKTTAMHVKNF